MPAVALVSPGSKVACVIDESGCGVHMTNGDADRRADELLRLSENPGLAEAMGMNARCA
jgi:hypothetical protein